MTRENKCYAIIIAVLILNPEVFAGTMVGECLPLDPSLLGSQETPSDEGLVSSSLLSIASRRIQDSIYYTDQLPFVKITSAVRTCQSLAVTQSKKNTVTFLVDYTCSGVACEQLPESVATQRYVHLFSYVCQHQSNTYSSWDNFYINRNTTNSISNPVTTADGKCVYCTIDPGLNNNPRFDPVTGCFGK